MLFIIFFSISPKGPIYDFSRLDKFIDLLHENELTVGFEIMGNPSDLFTDMENKVISCDVSFYIT